VLCTVLLETVGASSTAVLFWGKLLETIGAVLLAYVAYRVARYQMFVLGPVQQDEGGGSDLNRVGTGLSRIFGKQREKFGTKEALAVLLGTSLVALGCLIYLVGVGSELCEP
jgi:hypothetical protein